MDRIISLLKENKELPEVDLYDAIESLLCAGATYLMDHQNDLNIPICFDETVSEEDKNIIDWNTKEFWIAASAIVAFNYLLPQARQNLINEQIKDTYIDEDHKKWIDFLKDERESLSEAEFLNKYKGITLQKMCGKEIFAQKDEIDTEKEHYIIVSKDPETGSFRFKFN